MDVLEKNSSETKEKSIKNGKQNNKNYLKHYKIKKTKIEKKNEKIKHHVKQ